MTLRILASLALFLSYNTLAAALVVQIPTQNVLFEYTQPVRLSEVIQDIKDNTNDYSDAFYIANQLFDKNQQQKVIELKTSVITRLRLLDGPNSVLANTMIKQIESWNIGYRLFIPLDHDEILIQEKLNPILLGEYELIFPKRNHISYIEGLVETPSTVDVSNFPLLSEAVNTVKRLTGANDSFAWVIYPDGHTSKLGYAYWNNNGTQLPSNTSVFVGFNTDSKFINSLEKDIVKLISMRKVSQ